MERKCVKESDPYDWEKSVPDGSVTTMSSSTPGNYVPTPQGLKPDIAVANVSDLPRSNTQLVLDDSLRDEHGKPQAVKRRWSYAEGKVAKGENPCPLDNDGKIDRVPIPDPIAPVETVEGKRPQVMETKVRVLRKISFVVWARG